MPNNEVKWLLVGAGAVAGKRVAAALANTGPGKLVGVCDVSGERAAAIAGEHSVSETYTDFDGALSETTANAVYIATPVFLHVPQTVKALEAGKHVLVEKPLGVDGHDAARAVEAAKGTRLRAGCAYYRRCYPCYAQAARMLKQDEFGQIVLVRVTYFSWANPPPDSWQITKSKSGGGPLSDMGSHMFDAMIGLLGMPRRVCAVARTLVQPYQVEDTAAVLMELEGGAPVVASFNWNSKTWSHEFEIIGSEAKVKWHPYDSGKITRTVGRDTDQLDLPNAANVHQPLIEDFLEAVRTGREPVVPLPEARKTNLLLDAVYRSAETGAWTVPE